MTDTPSSPRTLFWNDEENASHVVRLEGRMVRLDQRLFHQNKMQRIEFALNNTDKFSFRINHRSFQLSALFYSDASTAEINDLHSPKLIEKILYEFRTGERVSLKFKYIQDEATENEYKESVDKFREQLVQQIHRLTGTKPYVEWGFGEATGKLSIWFSKEDYTRSKSS